MRIVDRRRELGPRVGVGDVEGVEIRLAALVADQILCGVALGKPVAPVVALMTTRALTRVLDAAAKVISFSWRK